MGGICSVDDEFETHPLIGSSNQTFFINADNTISPGCDRNLYLSFEYPDILKLVEKSSNFETTFYIREA